MRAAIVIPARFGSTRFPGKPLVRLTGATGIAKPLIQRSWEAASAVPGIARVVIATDDARIADCARGFGAEVAMTDPGCANGTERCAAVVAAGLTDGIDVIVNVQGDAPLTPPAAVTALLAAMADPAVAVATPAVVADAPTYARLVADAQAGRVGGTAVVTSATGDAMYFSRALLPHGVAPGELRLHLGVYAYTRQTLADYVAAGACRLEQTEGLEQLRFLHIGVPVRVAMIAIGGIALWELNNPSDVAPVEAALAARGIA